MGHKRAHKRGRRDLKEWGRKESNGIHVTKSRREDLLRKRKRSSKGESGEAGESSRGGLSKDKATRSRKMPQ